MVDKSSGLLTVLLKMDPGAELPDHEHVMLEQTFMIEGRLVDKDGPEKGLACGPGEFIWRPAGSRHSAWTPEGGLMIAVFQIPNKFYEKDGKVVDLVGDDWGLKWGKALQHA
jgi:anti-sigma factor ChrR (cupin superfamily)